MGITIQQQWWNPLKWKLGPRRYQGENSIEEWYHIGPIAIVIEVAE